MKKIALFFFLPFFIFSCSITDSIPEPDLPLEYTALANVSYGSQPRQVYDIYLPADRTSSTKTMILIHGGGWNSGSKVDMNAFRDFLREQFPELAVVNMNYRLSGPSLSPYPMQIEDISTVVDDLRERKDEYVIGEEIGFIGASAGGHLALLWSYGYDTRKQVEMVCSIVGPTNLTDEAYLSSTNEELEEMLDQFGFTESQLETASPLHRVGADAPPTILFYGGKDPLIPNSQGMDLRDRLEELDVPHAFYFYPNEGHGWIGLNLLDSIVKLRAFMREYI
ncbi:MAG TPA: alpha/beta hydrolase [Lunatimonas sp.]|nr:alpha/beta hydrolase [Lunatimonas sp.]